MCCATLALLNSLTIDISGERTPLPVKLTDPITPILYLTADREHLQELRHTIRVKEVGDGRLLETGWGCLSEFL